MKFWRVRDELSYQERVRRSYYKLLRDNMDQFILKYSLIDSYNNFVSEKISYPFVEMKELKPRGLTPCHEYESQNSFLIIFIEDYIPDVNKKYIRFFDGNKSTKANLLKANFLSLSDNCDRSQKYLDSVQFENFITELLPIDYALLIQRDVLSKASDRYCLSHFHVRIDWPIVDAAEDLAKKLRYISKDIYEKGDKYAEDLQKKFFEYYGLPMMVGGRRTAAIVAAQYFNRISCLSTIYVGSSESRALIRLSERGVSKSILIKIDDNELQHIAKNNSISPTFFSDNYVIARQDNDSICLFTAFYYYTSHAKRPLDGKLRELNPDRYWLTVDRQHLLPKPGVWKYPPISYNMIYG